MIEVDDDYDIIRGESIFSYWLIIGILISLQFYLLAGLFCYFSLTLIVCDEEILEEEEDHFYYEMSDVGDSQLSESLGYEFTFEDIETYIDQTNPITPFNHFNKRNLKFFKESHLLLNKKFNYDSFLLKAETPYSVTFLDKRQLNISAAIQKLDVVGFQRAHIEFGKRSKFVHKFRKNLILQRIKNTFLMRSYIASGIYPLTLFDFWFLYDKEKMEKLYFKRPKKKLIKKHIWDHD